MKYSKPRGNLTASTSRLRSENVWRGIDFESIQSGSAPGVAFYDDFATFPLIGTQTTQIAHGRYKIFATTGSSVVPVRAVNSVKVPGGCLKFATDTDNDSAALAQSYEQISLSGDPAVDGRMAFECCVAQKSVVTNMASSFIGLAETSLMTLATALPLNASDNPTNDGGMIGFQVKEDGLGAIDTVRSDRTTTLTSIGATEGGTLVAYTFKKLGIRYDPNDADKCVRFFTNNIECATPLTRAALQAYTNIDVNNLGLLCVTCADSAGTAHEFYMKWWGYVQEFVN